MQLITRTYNLLIWEYVWNVFWHRNCIEWTVKYRQWRRYLQYLSDFMPALLSRSSVWSLPSSLALLTFEISSFESFILISCQCWYFFAMASSVSRSVPRSSIGIRFSSIFGIFVRRFRKLSSPATCDLATRSPSCS